jgi:methylenetetrahydrofolate reductase (NADPH)
MAHFYGFSLGTESERRTILGNNPTVPQDIYNVFAKYVEGKVPQIPWCENPLQPESLLIQKQLVELNRKGFMTINSQPGVNGKPSDDPIVGWGGTGGYVYQKEYCECFCSPPHAHTLLKTIEKHPSMVMYAVNSKGIQLRSSGEVGAVTALTWGVFPHREIVQPTIFDPDVFLVWAEEAFATWGASWLPLYEKGTQSHALIEEIQNTFYLVAIIENDYISSGSTGDSLMWNTMLGCIDK